MTTNNDLRTTSAPTSLGGAHVPHESTTRDGGGPGPRLAGRTGAQVLAAVGRRAVTLAVAGALAYPALPPTTAHASQRPVEGDGDYWYFRHVDRDIDEVVAARKAQAARDYVELAAARSQFVSQRQQQGTARARVVIGGSRSDPAADAQCYMPETLDQWSRRLIAVQLCS